jgi:hypothetical protein
MSLACAGFVTIQSNGGATSADRTRSIRTARRSLMSFVNPAAQ